MTFQLMPEGDNFFNGKQNVLGKSYFQSLSLGDLLNREDVNPLLQPTEESVKVEL